MVINAISLQDIESMKWLLENKEAREELLAFIGGYGSEAKSIIDFVIENQLNTLTRDDFNFLIQHPDLLQSVQEFIEQNSGLSPEEITVMIRLAFVSPTNPIENLENRLNCFNTTSNSNYSHQIST